MRKLLILFLLFLALQAFSQILPQTGRASYYANRFHKRKTANGEHYSKDSFTAAHRALPFGTLVKVTNLKNNLSVIVRINDRGPRNKHRIIDLSRAAARKIGMLGEGITMVKVEFADSTAAH